MFKVYKQANATMAMWRDEGRCPMCGALADESDHVFGRGHEALLLKEHWMLRMSLCHPCHYEKHHGGGFNMVEQARKLKEANSAVSGEYLEECYFALNRSIAERMLDDAGKAVAFLDDWLVKNG